MTFTTIITIVFILAFMRPAFEALVVTVGEVWFHARFKTTAHYERLLIQITTVGNEYDRVCEIIERLRSYELPMNYEIWVVIEPGTRTDYDGANRVIVVPPDFTCLSTHKARAQEYTRRLRKEVGLGDDDRLKMLFLDDDVEPTRDYILTGFTGDYDICQGVTAPRIYYGSRGVKHFFLSHMDDMRFLACLVWCSFTQGVIQKPAYTHGEGLFLTAKGEQRVTWNYPIFASEDLVVGQNAARLGLRWGWFHEYVELTSPWGWRDYIKQRRRWLWGNIHAIRTRGVLPTWGRFVVAGMYIVNTATFIISTIGVILLLTSITQFDRVTYLFCYLSLVAYIVCFATSGWVNSGRIEPGTHESRLRYYANRAFQALAAVVLALTLITPIWTIVALVVSLIQGNPGGFEMIRKTIAERQRAGAVEPVPVVAHALKATVTAPVDMDAVMVDIRRNSFAVKQLR